ncbi:MAG: hypothetical protein EOP05_00420 [Proteobacteria bacterium]|nr:MAG: hypothetical protein EOP05_00420 [Pseudomonadota bacterium]
MAFACLLVISPFYLLGLGLLGITPLGNRLWLVTSDSSETFRGLALLLSWGVIFNFGIFMFSPAITHSVLTGTVLSIAGYILNYRFAIELLKKSFTLSPPPIVFALMIIALGVQILLHPLQEWDARSIWFFHAKFFYFNGSAFSLVGWTNPNYGFSHPDYPVLVPALASQVATVVGNWNEYLPKASILLMLIPALLLLSSYFRKRWSFVFLILMQLFVTLKFIDNGLMDGLIALYASLALLELAIAPLSKFKSLLVVSFFALAVGLKNEGQLLVLSIGLAFLISSLRFQKFTLRMPRISIRELRIGLLTILLFVPQVLWMLHVKELGLKNDMNLGMSSVSIILNRLTDVHSWILIGSSMFVKSHLIFWLPIFWLITKAEQHFGRVLGSSRIFHLFFAIYSVGLIAVYLSTPYDLKWHLSTSTTRTTLPLLLAMSGAAYVRLRNIDQNL